MMIRTIAFFADATVGPDLVGKGRYLSTTTLEWIIILGAIVLVCGAVVGWAVYLRKPGKDHHHHHHHRHSSPQDSGGGEGDGGGHRRRKWRRRRREHRPRNPTLAETGGLPPIRTQGPPSPPA